MSQVIERSDLRPEEATGAAGRDTRTPPASALLAERILAGVAVGLPALGLGFAIASRAISLVDVAIFVVMYTITGLGITVGFHRYFTHKSFECPRWVALLLAVSGSMAMQGPILRWVADHRRHHAYSDAVGDPHSPVVGDRGLLARFWHAHTGWLFGAEKTRLRRYAPDLMKDPVVSGVDRRYLAWLVLTLALPAALGGLATGTGSGALSALLWGGFARIFFIHHVTWCINSVCHLFGKRPYKTSDESRNVAWLAVPSFGESWHNAHHAFPTSAVHGIGRYQIDLSALLIGTLERLGLAWNVKRPTSAQVASRSVPPPAP